MSVDIVQMTAQLPPEQQKAVIRQYRLSEQQDTTAFLYCFFLGIFGVHKFYLGLWRAGLLHLIVPVLAVLALLAYLFGALPSVVAVVAIIVLLLIGLVWEIFDLFQIDAEVHSYNRALAERLVAGAKLQDDSLFQEAFARLDSIVRGQPESAAPAPVAPAAPTNEEAARSAFASADPGETQPFGIPSPLAALGAGAAALGATEALAAAPPTTEAAAPVPTPNPEPTVEPPAPAAVGENETTWPDIPLVAPGEDDEETVMVFVGEAGPDWTDLGDGGADVPVADVEAGASGAYVALSEDTTDITAPYPAYPPTAAAEPAAAATAAPLTLSTEHPDYTDSHPHAPHVHPIADIEPNRSDPVFVNLPEQAAEESASTPGVDIAGIAGLGAAVAGAGALAAAAAGVSLASQTAPEAPEVVEVVEVPPEAYVPPVPVASAAPEDTAPYAPFWPAANATPDDTQPLPSPEPAAPVVPVVPVVPVAPEPEPAAPAAAAPVPQRMKRVTVKRSIVIEGKVLKEVAVQKIVPVDADTAAVAAEIEESLGHLSQEQIAQLANLDTPVEVQHLRRMLAPGEQEQ